MNYLLLLVTLLTLSSAHAEDVSIAIADYPPYIDESKDNKGFMSEIVVKAFKKVGMNTDFMFRPWKRVEQVEVDKKQRLSFSWIKNDERSAKWHFSDSIMAANTVFVTVKRKEIKLKTLADLKPYRIGISRGYSYGNEFDNLKPQLKITVSASDKKNIKMLLADRIDIFLVDPYVGAEIIRNTLKPWESGQLEMESELNLGYDTMHVICAKSYSDCRGILDKFNLGLAKMRAGGSLQAIIDKAIALE